MDESMVSQDMNVAAGKVVVEDETLNDTILKVQNGVKDSRVGRPLDTTDLHVNKEIHNEMMANGDVHDKHHVEDNVIHGPLNPSNNLKKAAVEVKDRPALL